jgi:hypothetical protein
MGGVYRLLTPSLQEQRTFLPFSPLSSLFHYRNKTPSGLKISWAPPLPNLPEATDWFGLGSFSKSFFKKFPIPAKFQRITGKSTSTRPFQRLEVEVFGQKPTFLAESAFPRFGRCRM